MSRGKLKTLEEKLAKALMEWGENHLSLGGKESKIKAIAQALPVYIMSVFKVPARLCDDLTKMIRRFWWGAEKGRRKTHWRAWEKLIRPKSHGGMGFREFRFFNQALLAKQDWRILQFPSTLCARVLKARYFKEDTIPSASCSRRKGKTGGGLGQL